ncbi:hypothetical protein [Agrococcus beijingensis]|uniref:COG4315 family predicted lipoprotein n=1 Tax=Agrococcus beijingensis TaxID=3068634 RepID=UPI0027420026|nr:hypothetical protein [Agrococcus sp. REN33]
MARSSSIAGIALAMLLLSACASGSGGVLPTGTAPEPVVSTASPSVPATPAASEPDPSSAPAPESEPEPQAAGTAISTATSEFGEILWGPGEQVVYIWERDVSPESQCYDDCAAAWPPVLTDGEPTATGGVDPALLGTTVRADGALQVTYGGHPLYFYANEGPGEVRCHDVATHGGLWWVVTPGGERAP